MFAWRSTRGTGNCRLLIAQPTGLAFVIDDFPDASGGVSEAGAFGCSYPAHVDALYAHTRRRGGGCRRHDALPPKRLGPLKIAPISLIW